MPSTALIKARNQLDSTRARLAKVNKEAKEAPMKNALSNLAGNVAGGVAVGVARSMVENDDAATLVVAAGAGVAGMVLGSPVLVGVAGGALAVFAADHAEDQFTKWRAGGDGA